MKIIYYHDCQSCGKAAFQFIQGVHTANYAYRWVCGCCGTQMEITFSDDFTTSKQTPTGARCDNTLALFEVRGFTKMRFIFDGCAWDGNLEHDYFYHHATCPVNILRCEEIFIDGNSDPHGCFRLIKEVFITGPSAMPYDDAMQMLSDLARTHVSNESVDNLD